MVQVEKGYSEEAVAESLKGMPNVAFVEPDRWLTIASDTIPNDPGGP